MVENERTIKSFDKRKIDVILNDLEFIIKDANCKLSDQAKYDIISKIAWEWTEGRTTATKYYGCKYWSKGALRQVFGENQEFNVGNLLTYTKKTEAGLRHEHVVPKRLFMEYVWYLVKKQKFEKEKLKKYIENNLVACVITSAEDQKFSEWKIVDKLPESVENFGKDDFKNIEKFEDVKTKTWNRYKIAGLTEIYELEWFVDGKKNAKIIGEVLMSK